MVDVKGAFFFIMAVAAVAGWCVIEAVIWVLSHFTIGFAG